ncbi:MAG: amidohydrolase family protein [Dokdonella sp.]
MLSEWRWTHGRTELQIVASCEIVDGAGYLACVYPQRRVRRARGKTLGTLEPGKWADFILIDRDIVAGKPKDIWSTKVLETWVGGKRVYARDAGA